MSNHASRSGAERRGTGRVGAALALLLGTAAVAAGCKDTCAGVACGPAPPLITVTVYDTMTIDTTLTLPIPDTDSTRRVDTAIVVVRPVTAAGVAVAQISGSDTVVFDTLLIEGEKYYKYDASRMPAGRFSLVARRDSRTAVQNNLEIRQVDGCCSYQVVGNFNLQLR